MIFSRSHFRPGFALGGLLLLLWAGSSPAAAPSPNPPHPRTALVIGNARYESAVGKLRNTANDAKAVATTLRSLGFSVIEKHNVTRDQLLRLVEQFRQTLPGAEIALFYYAGHGISVDGSNYLVPLKSGFDPAGAGNTTLRMLAETHLFNAEQAVADMSAAGARCDIVILDACRNTPLTRDGQKRSLTGHVGLVEMTPPTGSLIAFATDAGRTAFDGDGANGLYTEELLKNMQLPGLTIEQVFKRTRAGVIARSEGAQLPAEYSRLIGDDIYLAGQASASPTPIRIEKPLPVETPPPPDAAALTKLAATGKSAECLEGLKLLARARGPQGEAAAPLEALLERVKDDLKEAAGPSTRVLAAADTCKKILQLLPQSLPNDDPHRPEIAARAHNRRGDALLLLGKADEAIKDYDAAQPLAPNDAYILYNRGRAHLALGQNAQAKADFAAATADHFDQPKAKKLALAALAGLP